MAAKSFDVLNPRIRDVNGKMPQIMYGAKEYDSQAFKAGQLVYSDVTKTAPTLITECASDGVILGIAMKDATNVTSSHVEIPVMLITPETELYIRCTNGGTDALASSFKQGEEYSTYIGTSGATDNYAYIDLADTSNAVLVFLGPVYDVNGDSTYWCRARVTAAFCQVST